MSTQVDATMRAARVLAGVVAESMARVESRVTPPQLRVLVLAASRNALNLTGVAAALDVHPSNATRTCDRLVDAGLLTRTQATEDRRQLRLVVTDSGRRLVESVMAHRRLAVERILARMPATARARMAAVLEAFAAAAGERLDDDTWLSDPRPDDRAARNGG